MKGIKPKKVFLSHYCFQILSSCAGSLPGPNEVKLSQSSLAPRSGENPSESIFQKVLLLFLLLLMTFLPADTRSATCSEILSYLTTGAFRGIYDTRCWSVGRSFGGWLGYAFSFRCHTFCCSVVIFATNTSTESTRLLFREAKPFRHKAALQLPTQQTVVRRENDRYE